MLRPLRKSCFAALKSEKGSFTLEATLVFPLIMLCTLTLLFFGMFVYQKVYLQQIAELAAERSAYVWDNSHKQIMTGNVDPAEHDGLYWRITQDSISDLFGMLVSNPPTTLQVPVSLAESSSLNKAEFKLSRVAALLPSGLTGTITYTNHGYERKVTVELKRPFRIPKPLFGWSHADQVEAQASSRVVEPVELIRLTDLTRSYVGVIKDKISPKAAKSALVEPSKDAQPKEGISFRLESEAASYLQNLVNGKAANLTTPSGKSRKVDALDGNGVSHQAFITFSENQLLTEQMPKDTELLRSGKEVKGVVWHFFKRKDKPTPAVSNKLRKELERNGIVVVIHG